MEINSEKEISLLLVALANSIHDRHPESNIKFTEAETGIVHQWLNKIFDELLADIFADK